MRCHSVTRESYHVVLVYTKHVFNSMPRRSFVFFVIMSVLHLRHGLAQVRGCHCHMMVIAVVMVRHCASKTLNSKTRTQGVDVVSGCVCVCACAICGVDA